MSTLKEATVAAARVAKWALANPGTATSGVAIGSGLIAVAAPAALTSLVLGGAGFGVGGIVSGSLASAVQSGIGSVIAPSLFATLQSAGAGGYGLAAVTGAVQAAGGGVTMVGTITGLAGSYWKK